MNDSGAKKPVIKCVIGIIMTQILAKTGIKKHRKLTREALFNIVFQLDDNTDCEGITEKDITIQQKCQAL